MNRHVFTTSDDLVPLADAAEWRAPLAYCYKLDRARGRTWHL